MSKFEQTEHWKDSVLHIGLKGVMDQDFSLDTTHFEGAAELVFDFNDLLGVNSCGVREWIHVMKSDAIFKKTVRFSHCHSNIIDQLTAIKSFRPKGAMIESLYLLYICDHCDMETEVLVQSNSPWQDSMEMNCGRCNNKMLIDGDDKAAMRLLSENSLGKKT